ncbi:MAG: hypothetical protein HUU16_15310, partial [Candidatus Omnitrophica bacterium]|nr:hypothetical protein [Candidatus Omnitrophota bacterium]
MIDRDAKIYRVILVPSCGGAWSQAEKWDYTWNVRDQMTKAEKFTGTSDTYAGKVEYRYCLSCDSALSDRIEYSPTVSTT